MVRSPIKAPRAQQKEATRERIRRAALELFVEKGFAATTTKAIAERAQVAAGTIFVHARDKEDLLFLVMHDQLGATVDEAFASLPDRPFLDRLMHIFGRLFHLYGELPQLGQAFVRNLPGASGPNASRVNQLSVTFMNRLATLITDAQNRGELAADLDPGQAAQNFFALYYMVLMGWLLGFVSLHDALDPGLRNAAALQIRGMLPR